MTHAQNPTPNHDFNMEEAVGITVTIDSFLALISKPTDPPTATETIPEIPQASSYIQLYDTAHILLTGATLVLYEYGWRSAPMLVNVSPEFKDQNRSCSMLAFSKIQDRITDITGIATRFNKKVSTSIPPSTITDEADGEIDIDAISPLAIHAIYRAAKSLINLASVASDGGHTIEQEAQFVELIKALEILERRWACAGEHPPCSLYFPRIAHLSYAISRSRNHADFAPLLGHFRVELCGSEGSWKAPPLSYTK